jgi:putative endonuclease
MKNYFVYILASAKNGTIYVGVTSNLAKRVWEHKNKLADGFTSKYFVDKLVYYEAHTEINIAIGREKRLKEWPRKWKLKLIEKNNLEWLDLYDKHQF